MAVSFSVLKIRTSTPNFLIYLGSRHRMEDVNDKFLCTEELERQLDQSVRVDDAAFNNYFPSRRSMFSWVNRALSSR